MQKTSSKFFYVFLNEIRSDHYIQTVLYLQITNKLRCRKPTAIFPQKIETLHVEASKPNNGMWWT